MKRRLWEKLKWADSKYQPISFFGTPACIETISNKYFSSLLTLISVVSQITVATFNYELIIFH